MPWLGNLPSQLLYPSQKRFPTLGELLHLVLNRVRVCGVADINFHHRCAFYGISRNFVCHAPPRLTQPTPTAQYSQAESLFRGEETRDLLQRLRREPSPRFYGPLISLARY